MKSAVVKCVVACLVVTAIGFAADRSARDAAGDTNQELSQQDLLLLGPLEPIRLTLTAEIDGVPFRSAWRNNFDRIFDQFDIDHDGRLTEDQARQVIMIYSRESASAKSDKTAMSRETVITRDELRIQIERISPPLVLRQRLSSGGAGPALVPLLDTDGDGRLSKDELNAAERSLHCRDFNDDQMIIQEELLAGPNLSSANPTEENGVANGSVILVTNSSDAPTVVADMLLSRYDRNRDGLLSLVAPVEILSTEGRLDKLDVDGNRQLDRNELRHFLNLPRDANIPFNLGNGAGGQKRAEALPQFRLRRKLDGGYRIHFGTCEIDFRRNNRDPSQDNIRPSLSTYDGDGNQTLDEAEFMAVPDHPEFAVVDTDKDGKLSVAEFDAFFLQRTRSLAAQLVLEISDQGADLFTALDRNFDRVLTPRELHQAAHLLDTEDRDGDGYLGGVEMSYNLILELSRGGSRAVQQQNLNARQVSNEPQVKADRSGPSWFLKMDRNRDGDVSLIEFIGSKEDFDRLDTDHDGLISTAEAKSVTNPSATAPSGSGP